MEITRVGDLPETDVSKTVGGMTIERVGDYEPKMKVVKQDGLTIKRVGGFQKPTSEPEGIYEGFVKPTVKSTGRVLSSAVASMILFPVAGIAGGLRTILEGPEKGNETIQEILGQPEKILKTDADRQALSTIMKPLEWVNYAAHFYGDKAYELTGNPDVGSTVATAFEAIALLATPKLKSKLTKSIKSRNPAKVKAVLDEIKESKDVQKKIETVNETAEQKPTAKPAETIVKEDKDSQISFDAREAVIERRSNLGESAYETNKFVNELERTTTKTEREAIPFAIEKTTVPESLGRADLQAVDLKKLSPVVAKVKQHFEKGWERVKKHLPEMSDNQIENYVTHIWDIPKNKRAEVSSWFSTQNKFLKKRYIPTIKEGIEKFGLKPKVLDVAEIIKIHDRVANHAIENAKVIKKLSSMKEDGVSLITRSDKAPEGWVSFDHRAINKTIHLPSTKKGGPTRLSEVTAKVHPDLVKPLQVILDGRIDAPVVNAYEAIAGILKKTNLSLSLFHHGALGETGVATMGLAKTANIYFNPAKIYKALIKGEFDVFAKEPIARDAISHGVQMGATADIPVKKIQAGLDNFARKTNNIPLLNKTAEFMATFNKKWDIALWDYLHDTLKLNAYEHLVSKIDMAKDVVMQKREIAQMVNDTFGGQNWDVLMVRPKTIQVASWGLLSPDWTISTVRQALAPTGFGKIYKETGGLRKKLGTQFWLKAGIYFGVGINMLNVVNRRADMKANPQYYKGKDDSIENLTMFGNSVGNKTRLFAGRYDDGTERYIRWGKQFRELPELLWDETGFNPVSASLKKIGGKANPVLQVVSQLLTGHSLSGYRNDDIAGKKGWEKTYGIAKTLVLAPFPFSLKTVFNKDKEFNLTDIAMPSGKGMSRSKAIDLFKMSIATGDEKLLKKVYQDTLQNNLPAFTLFGSALTSIRAEATKDINEGLNTIADAKKKLKTATGPEKKKIGRTLKRLYKEQADKKKGLKLLHVAIRRAEMEQAKE